MNDRRVIVYAIAIIGLSALVGACLLGALVILRLHAGDDIPPGVAAYLGALILIASNAGTLLAPSPLSKTSGSGDPTEVTGLGGGPVTVEDAG